MSRTKVIYFLSAIVLIIGCFALNTSYSLFVDNDTSNLVDITVPTITDEVTLSLSSVEVEGTKEYLIKQTITNNNDIPVGFRLIASSDSTTYLVQSTKYVTETEPELKENIYYSYGTVEANTTKDIYLRVANSSKDTSNIATINFIIEADYATLKMNTDEYIASANIDNETQYEITITSGGVPYSNNTNTLAYKLIEKQMAKFASTVENKNNLNEIFENQNKLTLPISIDGELNVTELTEVTDIETNDVGLYKAQDDYGVSYYYRGAIDYNYVNFAGMCWRIVRIAGDGSIKLILEDAYTTCDDTTDNDGTGTTDYAYTGNWNIGSGYYGYDEDEYDNYKLNYLNPENTGMSLAFKNYQTTLAKKIDSSIGTNPTTEQVNNTLASKLKVGDWCLDDSTYSDKMGTAPITDLTPYYSGNTSFYYGAYTRIYGEKTATLKCNGTIMNNFNDNGESSTPMYVATLTADEIVYAGADSNYSENYNYYLMNEYSSYSFDEETGEVNYGDYWWALSPYGFTGYFDYAFFVGYFGNLLDYEVTIDYSFRPAVSLKSSTTFHQGGEGTINNPYVTE